MRDYMIELERRLLDAARHESAPEARLRLRAVASSGLAIVLGVVVLIAATVAALALAGRSSSNRAYALPVLARPVTGASDVDARTRKLLVRNGADLEAARSISTPNGTAYAMPRPDGLCLSVPDGTGAYGEACATTAEVLRRGLPLAVRANSAAPTLLVVVLPSDGSLSVRRSDGSVAEPAVTDGTAMVTVHPGDTMTTRTAEATTSLPALEGSGPSAFASGAGVSTNHKIVVECDHGHRKVVLHPAQNVAGTRGACRRH
jgi:hypothetical protein